MRVTYRSGKAVASSVAVLFIAFIASARAAPSGTHEGSWRFEVSASEVNVGPGTEMVAADSTLDITLITSGNLVCGHYDGAVAKQRCNIENKCAENLIN